MPCSKTVLIVEDEPAIREMLELTLGMEGYKVALAANGRQALDVLSRIEPPCAILLDLMMPVMNGFEFCEAIQDRKDLHSVPILVLTAYSDLADRVKNARCILGKPIEFELLFQTLKEFCG